MSERHSAPFALVRRVVGDRFDVELVERDAPRPGLAGRLGRRSDVVTLLATEQDDLSALDASPFQAHGALASLVRGSHDPADPGGGSEYSLDLTRSEAEAVLAVAEQATVERPGYQSASLERAVDVVWSLVAGIEADRLAADVRRLGEA